MNNKHFFKLLITSLILMFLSCNQKDTPQTNIYEPGNTPLESLKSMYSSFQESNENYRLTTAYYKKYQKDILESLEVVDTVIFKYENDEKIIVTFYKYFIKTNPVRKVEYFKEFNDKYYKDWKYFGSYKASREEKDIHNKIEDWESELIMELD